MKNLNSFKAITRAIAYETRRQIECIEEGKRVIQETRRWDDNKDATFSMRSKESAQDYRYFPEPDIPPLELSEEFLQTLRAQQPEMAPERQARYQRDYGLTEQDARLITGQKALVDFFEAAVACGAPAKEVCHWMLGEMMRRLKEEAIEPKQMKLTPDNLARLIALVDAGRLNRNTAAKVFRAVFPDNGDVERYVQDHGLEQVNDTALVEQTVARVLKDNPAAVADYQGGNQKVAGFLVGQAMRQLKGKADPAGVKQAVEKALCQVHEGNI